MFSKIFVEHPRHFYRRVPPLPSGEFVILKPFFSAIDAVWKKLALARISSLYFALLFRVQRADRCRKSTKQAVLNLMENWEINRSPHSKGLIRSMVDLISEGYMEYERVWPLNRTSYSGDSRRYQFYALAGPVNTAATQILKIELRNYGHNIPRRFT